jgi:hypothetical protein
MRLNLPRLTFTVLLGLLSAFGPLSGPKAEAAEGTCREAGLPSYRIDGAESYASYREKTRDRRRRCTKEWTVLVYMAADNDLGPYAFWDLYEMEAGFRSGLGGAGSTTRVDLVVQLDTPGREGIRRFHMHQAPEPFDDRLDFEFFRNRRSSDLRSPQIGETLAEDPARPQSEARKLKDFLTWGFREFPAKNTFVIVWGHGQGWTSRRARVGPSNGSQSPIFTTPSAFGGVAFNETQSSFIGIPSLASVLSQVSREVLGGRPVDVYASDACLMQMTEVASELRESVRFIAGSAQVHSFLGLPYRRLMYELNTGRLGTPHLGAGLAQLPDEAEKIARALPHLLEASLKPGGSQARFAPKAIETVTLSTLATGPLHHELLPALDTLGMALLSYVQEGNGRDDGPDVGRLIALDEIAGRAPSFQGSATDLGAFLTLLEHHLQSEYAQGRQTRAGQALRRTVTGTREALSRTVLEWALGTEYRRNAESFHLFGFRGLSAWIPASADDRDARLQDFRRSRMHQRAPGWSRWIGSLHGGVLPP